MSFEDLENQLEKLMTQRDKLEENCDTLPECKEDDGCETCKVYSQIEEIDEKIDELEDKIEELLGEEEE